MGIHCAALSILKIEPLLAHPRREGTALSHAANAFTGSTRTNNLETINFTIESLAVTGAAAPVFLLKTDDKGRRPVRWPCAFVSRGKRMCAIMLMHRRILNPHAISSLLQY